LSWGCHNQTLEAIKLGQSELPFPPKQPVEGANTARQPNVRPKKIAALTLAAASADMRDLGAVFDHDEPLPHPALYRTLCHRKLPSARPAII